MKSDLNGREYASMSALKAGCEVQVDADFACIEENATRKVMQDDAGLYILCSSGFHYLDGQLDDCDYDSLIGVYPLKLTGEQL